MAGPEPIPVSVLLTCAACGEVKSEEESIECPQCKDIRYCDSDCQELDKPVHDLLCDTLADFDPHNPPSPTHGRAILFPDNDERPRFVWINRLRNDYWDCDGILGVHTDSHNMTKLEDKTCPAIRIRTQTIYLIYVDSAIKDEYAYDGNASIEALSNLKGVAYDWRGPVLAVRYADHLNMRDFRAIVDHLQSYPKNNALMGESRYGGDVYPGIKLNTAKDMNVFGTPPLQPLSLSKAMVLDQVSSPFALFSELKPQLYWRHAGAIHFDSVNRHGLLVFAETSLPGFGVVGPSEKIKNKFNTLDLSRLQKVWKQGQPWSQSYIIFREGTGSIVRRIEPLHIEVLEAFLMEQAQKVARGGFVMRDMLKKELTTEAFTEFWRRYTAARNIGGHISAPFMLQPSPKQCTSCIQL